jgi:hypothetical protein
VPHPLLARNSPLQQTSHVLCQPERGPLPVESDWIAAESDWIVAEPFSTEMANPDGAALE